MAAELKNLKKKRTFKSFFIKFEKVKKLMIYNHKKSIIYALIEKCFWSKKF